MNKYKAFVATERTGSTPIWVEVNANDHSQARELIENLYGPITAWYRGPDKE